MEKIWLKNYQPGVPAEINPDVYSSLVDIFHQSCKQYANQPAFSNLDHTLTYAEIAQRCQRFAAYLQQDLQLKKGDRLAIMMPNLLQYPIALFGAFLAGLTIVNVNPLYTPSELQHQLNDAGASAILVLANFAHILERALPQTKIRKVIITEVGDEFPSWKRLLVNFVVKYLKRMVPEYQIPGSISYRQVLERGNQLTLTPVPLKGDDIAFLQYTGGTTGVAKGAMLTHRNMVANIEQVSAWVKPVAAPGREVVITALPLYHIFSLTANCLLFFKLGGLNVLITNPRDIAGLVKQMSEVPFTTITGVNTLYNAMVNYPAFSNLDFSHLRVALGGGMSVHHAVAERWQAITKHPLIEAYGLTETSPGVTVNPLNLDHYNGSIGLPISSTEVSIRDDNNQEVAIGDSGELCIKGPQVMLGYWNRPDETAKTFTSDGWLKTGDIATIDNAGFVRIVDRKKDMIIVSGFNVYPNEIEDTLTAHPGVQEAAVVGVPDPATGEAVRAYVVRKDLNLTKDELIKYCRTQLTGYKIPKQIEFRNELPKTNVGKILRRALRETTA